MVWAELSNKIRLLTKGSRGETRQSPLDTITISEEFIRAARRTQQALPALSSEFNDSAIISMADYRNARTKKYMAELVWRLDNLRRANPSGFTSSQSHIDKMMGDSMNVPSAIRKDIILILEGLAAKQAANNNVPSLKAIFGTFAAMIFKFTYDPHADKPLGEFRIKWRSRERHP